MSDNVIILSDRIKQYSLSTGTGDIVLTSSAQGFSDFNTIYSHGDALFYAATDGTRYEVGSGVFNTGVAGDFIERFPFRSSNSDAIVDFPAGTKEIYSTYPATHAVYTGSGVADLNFPQSQGIAFWASSNVLDYDSNVIWDKANTRLGIAQPSPNYGIDIGGDARTSSIGASGLYLGSSGIYFPSGNNGDASYFGGRQLTHYEMNRLDDYAYNNTLIGELTGSSEVIELSGAANQYILFTKQNAGSVFAGPPSGCAGPCSPDYPSFRNLVLDDFPFLTQASGSLNNSISTHVHGNISNSGTLNGSGVMVITDNDGYVTTSELPSIKFQTISNYNDVGVSGQISFDDSYAYFHVPSGDSPTGLVWKRTSINIW